MCIPSKICTYVARHSRGREGNVAMSVTGRAGPRGGDVSLDRAVKRVVAFLIDGLAHGHFDLRVTGEVTPLDFGTIAARARARR
jgi:hypothetical protein